MSPVLPSPFDGPPVPIVAVLVLLVWLFFAADTGRRRSRRLAVIAYLLALALVVSECILWLAGRR
ncbi:MAG TPA: hypothetical protein VE993_15125 [Stellaceae bacterium]|nr:hypothetical protein [Stellaceae bacterium]